MKIEIHSSFVKAARKLPANFQHKVADIIIEMEVEGLQETYRTAKN